MERIIDTWNGRDLDGFVDCFTDPLVVQGEGEDVAVSRDQHREAAQSWWDRFPDLTETIQETVVEGDRVCLRTRSTGTLQAPWRGIEPSGQRVDWDAWYAYRVRTGSSARSACSWTGWGCSPSWGQSRRLAPDGSGLHGERPAASNSSAPATTGGSSP